MLRWAPQTQKQLRIMRLSRKVGILNATGVCHQTQSLEVCAVSERVTASYIIAAITAFIPVVRRDILLTILIVSNEANFPGKFSFDLSQKRVKKTPFIRLTNFHPPAKYDLPFYPTSDVGYDKPLKLIHSFGPGTAGTFTTTLILSSPHRLPLDSSSGHKVAPAFHFFQIGK